MENALPKLPKSNSIPTLQPIATGNQADGDPADLPELPTTPKGSPPPTHGEIFSKKHRSKVLPRVKSAPTVLLLQAQKVKKVLFEPAKKPALSAVQLQTCFIFADAASKSIAAYETNHSKCAVWCHNFHSACLPKIGNQALGLFCDLLSAQAGPQWDALKPHLTGFLSSPTWPIEQIAQLLARGLRSLTPLDIVKLLKTAFVTIYSRKGLNPLPDASYEQSSILKNACEFICLILDTNPQDAAHKIQTAAPHFFDAASDSSDDDKLTGAARAVVTYLSIKANLKADVKVIRATVEGNQALFGTDGNLILDKMLRRSKEILRDGFPSWQTLQRTLYTEFGFDRTLFESIAEDGWNILQDRLKKAMNTTGSAPAELYEHIALWAIVCKHSKVDHPVTAGDVTVLIELFNGQKIQAAERGNTFAFQSVYVALKVIAKMDLQKQLEVLESDAMTSRIAALTETEKENLQNFKDYLAQRRKKKANRCRDAMDGAFKNKLPVRWSIGWIRGGTAQAAGRVIATYLPSALTLVMNSVGAGLWLGSGFVVDLGLKVLAVRRQKDQRSASAKKDNPRPYTNTLINATLNISLLAPIGIGALTLGSYMLADYPEWNYLDLENGVEFLGIGLYAAFELQNLTIGRLIRQFFQSSTTSNLSAGMTAKYADSARSPLSDDDRELANALRDAPYVISGTALLLAGTLTADDPYFSAMKFAVICTAIVEANDEIFPDLGPYMLKIYRDYAEAYKGSDARIVMVDTPSPDFFAQGTAKFWENYRNQSAGRITHFALADCLSIVADILRKRKNFVGFVLFKLPALIISMLFGARRGGTLGYFEHGSTVPSGLLTFLLRMATGRTDAIGRVQREPVLNGEVISLSVVNGKLDTPKLAPNWPWNSCRKIKFDSRTVAVVYRPDNTDGSFFHQAEQDAVAIAAFNMLRVNHDPLEIEFLLEAASKNGKRTDRTFQDICEEIATLKAEEAGIDLEMARHTTRSAACFLEFRQNDRAPETVATLSKVLKHSGFALTFKCLYAQQKIPRTEALYVHREGADYAIYSPRTDKKIATIDGTLDFFKQFTEFMRQFGVGNLSSITIAYNDITITAVQFPPLPPEQLIGRPVNDTAVPAVREITLWGQQPVAGEDDLIYHAKSPAGGAPDLVSANMLTLYLGKNKPEFEIDQALTLPAKDKPLERLQAIAARSKKLALCAGEIKLSQGIWQCADFQSTLIATQALVVARDRADQACLYVLDSRLAVPTIKTVTDRDMLALVKEYVLNSPEQGKRCEILYPV